MKKEDFTDRGQSFLSGLGLGAALMYVFDPYWGRRRRSLARDQMIRALNKTADAIDATSQDLLNRTQGIWAETRARFTPEEVDDDILVARVRAKLGRMVSHPRAIDVTAREGRVTLRGPVLQHEVKDLRKAVSNVRGVVDVEDQLSVHESPEDMPSLQGGVPRPGGRFELAQEYWSPTARLLVGATGSALLAWAAERRDLLGLGLGTLGLGLLARSFTNMELKRLTGIGSGHRAVDVQKTIQINAPVEEVFAFWSRYENFPHFMRNVREVIDKGNGRSHWIVAGPAGSKVEWEAEVTQRVDNEVLAWKTTSGASVEHAGYVRFSEAGEGRTRVDIKLSYNPPGGAIGHAVATLFGSDPETEMDEDMVRMKTMIETGNPPHDASKPERGARARQAGGKTRTGEAVE